LSRRVFCCIDYLGMAEAIKPRPLGLERLSLEGVALVGVFIHDNIDGQVDSRLSEAYFEELCSVAERNMATPREKTEELARSKDIHDRHIGCEIVAHLAVRDPDTAYPLWCDLMRDPDIDVQETAAVILAKHLGNLALDAKRVVELIEAHLEAERVRYRSGPAV
jgi:hypothetical protein